MGNEAQEIIEGMSGSELDMLRRDGFTLPTHLQIRWESWKRNRKAEIRSKWEQSRREKIGNREQAANDIRALRQRRNSAA